VACAESGAAWLTVRLRISHQVARGADGSAVAAVAAVAQAFGTRPWGRPDSLLPPKPCNVGCITAGEAPNQGAATGEVRIDIRPQPEDVVGDLVAWSGTIVADALAAARIEAEHEIVVEKFTPATRTDLASPAARRFAATVRSATGQVADVTAMAG